MKPVIILLLFVLFAVGAMAQQLLPNSLQKAFLKAPGR